MPKTVVCLEGKGIELVPVVRTVDKGHDLASVKPWVVGDVSTAELVLVFSLLFARPIDYVFFGLFHSDEANSLINNSQDSYNYQVLS